MVLHPIKLGLASWVRVPPEVQTLEQSTGMGVYKNKDSIQTRVEVNVSCNNPDGSERRVFFKKNNFFFDFLKKTNYFCIHVL